MVRSILKDLIQSRLADVGGRLGVKKEKRKRGSRVSKRCSFLLHVAHDELCDGKMLLLENERQNRASPACDEAAAPLFPDCYSLSARPCFLESQLGMLITDRMIK